MNTNLSGCDSLLDIIKQMVENLQEPSIKVDSDSVFSRKDLNLFSLIPKKLSDEASDFLKLKHFIIMNEGLANGQSIESMTSEISAGVLERHYV
jgi:hypothetical protein